MAGSSLTRVVVQCLADGQWNPDPATLACHLYGCVPVEALRERYQNTYIIGKTYVCHWYRHKMLSANTKLLLEIIRYSAKDVAVKAQFEDRSLCLELALIIFPFFCLFKKPRYFILIKK